MEGEYKVIELEKYGGKLSIATRKFRKLQKGEVLVKMMGTTIHPADLMFLIGEYGDEKPSVFPLIPGFEGCGEIVQVGEGLSDKLIGQRVSVSAPFRKDGAFFGVWAEYNYSTMKNIILFNNTIEYEKIGFALTNPLTAVGFLDTVRKSNTKAVIQDGASGALGKMFIRLCAREGITTINLVRNKYHILPLKKLGADYVISTDETGWGKQVATLSQELKIKVFFDCVGGNLPGKILSLLPSGTTLYNFGNLEIKKLGIDSGSLIFKDKKVAGWWLLNWLKSLKPEEIKYWYEYVANDLKSGSDLFVSKIGKTMPLKLINEAIGYYTKNMSSGKVFLTPKF